MPVKGGYLALAGAGIIVAYSGLKGKGIGNSLRAVIAGQSPSKTATTAAITQDTGGGSGGNSGTIGGTTPNVATVAAYKAYAMSLLVRHGWANQWGSYNSVVMAESGWNNNAKNPQTGAYGIAQALGHGTVTTAASNGENNYGNFGTSDAVCKAANSGNGTAQIQWMLNYIAMQYGSPDNAWASEQSRGYY